jgi:hypothetical protein
MSSTQSVGFVRPLETPAVKSENVPGMAACLYRGTPLESCPPASSGLEPGQSACARRARGFGGAPALRTRGREDPPAARRVGTGFPR